MGPEQLTVNLNAGHRNKLQLIVIYAAQFVGHDLPDQFTNPIRALKIIAPPA